MTDEQYMKLAIQEAKKAEKLGWVPLGVVLVKNGKILAQGTSHVGELLDPTAHGETWVMREACQKLKSLDLSGCTLYSTMEPCSMCLACAGWTGLSRMLFGAYQEDAPDSHYERPDYHAEELAPHFPHLEVTGGLLRQACKELMRNVKNWELQK